MRSLDVTWSLDDITMRGTLTLPSGEGPFPAVVFVAGSGPTDRDWCSPLLPGTNGSARLFAETFADAGIASLRYDKRASGPDVAENARKLFGTFSMQSHLDELVAAVNVLIHDEHIDAARLVGLGNSEGTLHVLHYATSEQAVPFIGLVLLAPPGRPVSDVLLSQLSLQASQVPGGSALLAMASEAAARYSEGEPMSPDSRLPESVRMALESFEAPANLPLARELWNEDAVDALRKVTIPTLLLIGRKDLQIDVTLDGGPLERATEGLSNVEIEYPEHANHVFKEERRTTAEVVATPGNGYNAEGTHLDPEAVSTVLEWLRTVLGSSVE